jgi:hypothetical protein
MINMLALLFVCVCVMIFALACLFVIQSPFPACLFFVSDSFIPSGCRHCGSNVVDGVAGVDASF